MIDLAVKLEGFEAEERVLPAGFRVHKTGLEEAIAVAKWIHKTFSRRWSQQYFEAAGRGKGLHATDAAGQIIGFASFDVPKLGYFGPLGVGEAARGHGVGAALTVAALAMMESAGYGFAMIHHVGPIEFYRKFLKFTEVRT